MFVVKYLPLLYEKMHQHPTLTVSICHCSASLADAACSATQPAAGDIGRKAVAIPPTPSGLGATHWSRWKGGKAIGQGGMEWQQGQGCADQIQEEAGSAAVVATKSQSWVTILLCRPMWTSSIYLVSAGVSRTPYKEAYPLLREQLSVYPEEMSESALLSGC